MLRVGEFPGEVRQCSGKRYARSIRPFRGTSEGTEKRNSAELDLQRLDFVAQFAVRSAQLVPAFRGRTSVPRVRHVHLTCSSCCSHVPDATHDSVDSGRPRNVRELGRAVSLWPLCRDTVVVTEESTDTRAPANGTVGSLPWLIVASELPCGVTCSPVPW